MHELFCHRNLDVGPIKEEIKKIFGAAAHKYDQQCAACIAAGGHDIKGAFSEGSTRKATRPGQRLHYDCFYFGKPNRANQKYMLAVIDEMTQKIFCVAMYRRSEVRVQLQAIVREVEAHFQMRCENLSRFYAIHDNDHAKKVFPNSQQGFYFGIASIRADGAGENTSDSFRAWCKKRGIRLEYSTPHIPQQNGLAEVTGRYIVQAALALLHSSGLPDEYWYDAVLYYQYVHDRFPSGDKNKPFNTPYEGWWGIEVPLKTLINPFRRLGCQCFRVDPSRKREKKSRFDKDKSARSIFLGYATNEKSYLVQNMATGKVTPERHVYFDEGCLPFKDFEPAQYEWLQKNFNHGDPGINTIQYNHAIGQVPEKYLIADSDDSSDELENMLEEDRDGEESVFLAEKGGGKVFDDDEDDVYNTNNNKHEPNNNSNEHTDSDISIDETHFEVKEIVAFRRKGSKKNRKTEFLTLWTDSTLTFEPASSFEHAQDTLDKALSDIKTKTIREYSSVDKYKRSRLRVANKMKRARSNQRCSDDFTSSSDMNMKHAQLIARRSSVAVLNLDVGDFAAEDRNAIKAWTREATAKVASIVGLPKAMKIVKNAVHLNPVNNTKSRAVLACSNFTNNKDSPTKGEIHNSIFFVRAMMAQGKDEAEKKIRTSYEETILALQKLQKHSIDVPDTRKDMLKQHPDRVECFLKAEIDELDSFSRLEVWSLVPRPHGRKALKTRWVYDNKYDGQTGLFSKHKARLVVKGFLQVRGQDFDETFSPTAKMKTLKALLTLCAGTPGMSADMWDVSTAFLYAPTDAEIYIDQPEGHLVKGKEDWVYKLHKSVYGQRQASRNWFIHLSKTLATLGFEQSKLDECVYMYRKNGTQMYILAHVDDMAVFCDNDDFKQKVLKKLCESFAVKDEGPLAMFLGVQISRMSDGSFEMSQKHYIDALAERFKVFEVGPQDCQKSYSPSKGQRLLHSDQPDNDADLQRAQKLPYRELVGALNYCTITRPDILYPQSQICKFMSLWGVKHWEAALDVLRFCIRTSEDSLIIRKLNLEKLEIVVYADSDWFGDVDPLSPNPGPSHGGHAIYLTDGVENALIHASSKKHTSVSLSSQSAEIQEVSEAAKEIIWLRHLLTSFGIEQNSPTICYEDNAACISFSKGIANHKRTKHILLRYYWLHQSHKAGVMRLKKIDTAENIADIFTKPLPKKTFLYLRNRLMGYKALAM